MANTSVDGLVSGLSTSTIIEQLMSLERQPQLRLTRKRATNDEKTPPRRMRSPGA